MPRQISKFLAALAAPVGLLACGLVSAEGVEPARADPAVTEKSPYALSANLGLVSDYRFRGISQSYRLPAVQGGFDLTHTSGLYLGNWDSSVSGNSYNNGASLEMDLYGGYRFEPVKDLNADVGLLFYVYPGARLNIAPGVPGHTRYDNTEVYASLGSGPISAKLSVALTDYFGLKAETAGYAYAAALADHGSSRGTAYVELNYSLDLGHQLTGTAHVGRTIVRHYQELSYTDLKLGLSRELLGVTLGAALVATDASRHLYQVADAGGNSPKKTGTPTLVVSVLKTF